MRSAQDVVWPSQQDQAIGCPLDPNNRTNLGAPPLLPYPS